MALAVAVTGPTGEIGTSVVRALERERRVGRLVSAMPRCVPCLADGARATSGWA
jgi:UDP-glucose 4-epimerase